MHHRCSSYGNNMVGPCTCGLLHDHDHDHAQTNSFSMLFSNDHKSYDEAGHQMTYPFNTSSYSVDCTLSLGTPSTRLTSDHQDNEKRNGPSARGRTGSNFGCWDFLQAKSLPSYPTNHKGSSRGGSNHSLANSDPLLARRCANCDTTSTPLWRNGPRGPKSLCNACGIRFKKEERRATAANANTASATTSGAADHHFTYQNNSWVQAQKMPCFSPANEFRFIEDSDSDTGNIPFLSWRLNVTDRPSLVHDFTR